MTTIPHRAWYSIKETAQLTGMSEDFLRDRIRKGQRRNPTADAITCVRKFGTEWRIHRSYIYPDEPGNVTPLRSGLNDAAVDAIAARVIELLGRGFSAVFADQTKRSA